MFTVMKDIRYAARAMYKRPLLTLTVAATLALGLGANAAIFNLIDRLILRPFPLKDPDAVVLLAETGPRIQYRKETVSPLNFFDWRAQTRTLSSLSAYSWWDANLVERDEPERLPGFQITSGFFEAMQVHPALGGGEEGVEVPNRHAVASVEGGTVGQQLGQLGEDFAFEQLVLP